MREISFFKKKILLIFLYFDQVFKDEFNGIVCYVNEDGEIICEGWDEGFYFIFELEKGYIMRLVVFCNILLQKM